MHKIILASQSPRRRELLTQVGIEYEVMPSKVKEKITKSVPVEIVIELSRQKALDVGENAEYGIRDGCVVIGADTIVVRDGIIMGKPKDRDDAICMLESLQGKTHSVYTGVTLYYKNGQEPVRVSFTRETKVTFYSMSKMEIERYVDSKEPMDKAGAYGIQGLAAAFIEKIEGDYNNVVGLPIAAVYQELKERGWL